MMDDAAEPVAIPYQELSPDALRGVVEAFILREGTDYGRHEYSLEDKVTHVMRQLERRQAQILFDPNTESIAIVVKREIDAQRRGNPQEEA